MTTAYSRSRTLIPALIAVGAALAIKTASANEVTKLRVLAINDFHGNLEPVAGQGGAVALAATLARLRAGHANTIFVSSGDLIGASPLPSALAHDEPTLSLFNYLGLRANAVGNHELDGGLAELRRQEALAGFPFLSANLVEVANGKPAFAPYRVIKVDGVSVAFVGATVRNALKSLEPGSVPGLRLDDEAEALNAQARELRAQGVHALIALLHEGAGAQDSVVPETGCDALAGPAREITEKLDPDYDLVLSAHTHALYACRVGRRWLVQGGAKGQYLSVADLELDRKNGDVVGVEVRNEKITTGASAEPEVAKLVGEAVAASAKIADEPIAVIPVNPVSATMDGKGGSVLGRIIAQAQLSAGESKGARLACTNPSSVPHDLVASLPDNVVTYADVRAVQPYGNHLKVLEVSGAELAALLEQQWRQGSSPAELSCSPGLEYRLDGDHRLVPGSLRLSSKPVGDSERFEMVVNGYLARGGQGFGALTSIVPTADLGTDLDALLIWLRAHAADHE